MLTHIYIDASSFIFPYKDFKEAEEALLEKRIITHKQRGRACRKPQCTRSKEKYFQEKITRSAGKNNGHP